MRGRRLVTDARIGAAARDLAQLLDPAQRTNDACQVLAIADNNVSRAAEMLGMTRPTLYDLMDRYGLRNAGHK